VIRQTTENKRNLKQQIKTRTIREKKTRDKMVAEEEAANDLIRNDDTLMAIYPKIKAVPEYLRKQNETKANKKLTEANKIMLDAKNSEMLAQEKLIKETYNRELKHFIKLEEERKANEELKRRKDRAGCTLEWDDAMRAKKLEQKVEEDTKKIVARIRNGTNIEESVGRN
jgi:hypothetical protein